MSTDPNSLSARELAARIRRGELKAADVIRDTLDRVAKLNPQVNAIVQDCSEDAMAEAHALDARIARGEQVGALAGVPVTIKVLSDQKGYASTNSCRIFENVVATQDNPFLRHLRQHDAIAIGRTNTPAFSYRWFTSNNFYGETRNPHNPALTAGGAPQERVVALIDEGVTLNYGVQANDAAFTDLMRGLTMLAAVDVSQISDPDAYAAYVTEAVDAISVGIGGVLAAETQLGAQQKLVEDTSTALEDVNDIYNSRILALEAVDPYEAATRLSQLETQLQSSYAVTARLMNLSLLNFLV